MDWIRRDLARFLADLSPLYTLLSATLSTTVAIVVGWGANMPAWVALSLGIGLCGSLMFSLAAWKHERCKIDEAMDDICDDLVKEADGIREQERAKDWCKVVEAALFGANMNAEWATFAAIMQSIVHENKPSEALVSTIVRRGAIYLRTVGVRLRKIDAMMDRPNRAQGFRAAGKLYSSVLEEANHISTLAEAKEWGDKARSILLGTGHNAAAVQLNGILARLSETNHLAVVREASELFRARTLFAVDIADEPQAGSAL